MSDCVFCKIVSGELPSRKLYEDERVVAFLDAFPAVKGHTLIVPKQHSSNILEDDEVDAVAVMKAVRLLAPKLIKALEADGINMTSNIGASAGQQIFHTHVHLLPRFQNDGKSLWKPMEEKPDLETLAETIRSVIPTSTEGSSYNE